MSIINRLNTPFFLTGGTALSRHYFNHRYSDDLDLFVNACEQYQEMVSRVLNRLMEPQSEISFQVEKDTITRYENYTQFFVNNPSSPELRLKIDLVNDVAEHFGKNEYHQKLGAIDSWCNILSNKITAIFRFEPKDIADIWIIAKNKTFDWKSIIREAKTKEAGVEPEQIFKIIKSFPIAELNMIKWVKIPDFNAIQRDLDIIAEDILFGRKNS
jgi:predicted nucleotidyltransferase component of viral defense system